MKRTTLIIATLVSFLSACGDDSSGEETATTSAASSSANGATAAAVDTSLPGDPEAGAAVYNRICVACHARDGRGTGGLTGANFVDDTTRLSKGNDELLTSIREGRPNASPAMPPQGQALTDQEMRDVLAYIRYTFGGTRE